MDPLLKLFETLHEEELFENPNKTFEEFKKSYEDDDYKSDVPQLCVSNDLYDNGDVGGETYNYNTFVNKYKVKGEENRLFSYILYFNQLWWVRWVQRE